MVQSCPEANLSFQLSASMSYSDLVSVIIPTYNRDRLLIDALESVRCQTYRPIEAIVIDDGSTDDTQEVVKRFSEANSSKSFRISYLCQNNRGPSAARNTGLKAASGEYVQFLDSDDLIHPRKLEIQVGLLKSHPQIRCIFSERFKFKGLPNWDSTDSVALKFQLLKGHELYCSFNALTNSGIYKKEICLLAEFWNEEMHLCEDLEFNLRVLNLCDEILYIRSNLAGYRQHDEHQITTSLSRNETRYANLSGLKYLQKTALAKVKKTDPKLFESIGILYNRLALDFMLYGDRSGALKTIHSCKQMPLSQQRLQRLTILTILAHMPSFFLRIMWKVNEYYRAAKSPSLTNQCN